MIYQQNLDGLFAEKIGENGFKPTQLDLYRQKFLNAQERFNQIFADGSLPLFKLPYLRKDLLTLTPHVERFQDDFTDVVIIGTGGSSLGGQTLRVLSEAREPRLHFLDNVDPATFEALFKTINPQQTGFVVVSKSGGTAETLAGFLSCLNFWRQSASDNAISDHFLVITEKKPSPLMRLAEQWSMPVVEHDPDLGGRFSVLSVVGMLPAMLVGIDPLAVRKGAQDVLEHALKERTLEENLPAMGAVAAVILGKRYPNSVLMPYVDRLAYFAKWYRQLWAESLGKQGKGTTPLDALGTVDQHSQLQLYLDGPLDKVITLIGSEKNTDNQAPNMEGLPDDELLSLLNRTSLSDLLRAEFEATRDTLIQNRKPVRVITYETLNAETLGALLMHFMLETLYAAELLNVNPFDQPAVEQGKVLAREYLAKSIE